MLIRMICGSPQTDRPTDRPTERKRERERWGGEGKERRREASSYVHRLHSSTWPFIPFLVPSPTESKPCAPDVSRVYPTIHRLLIPTQTSKRPLGPWRNQFKWLSVDVIDFHFTRLSGKTLHPPLPSPPPSPPLSLLPHYHHRRHYYYYYYHHHHPHYRERIDARFTTRVYTERNRFPTPRTYVRTYVSSKRGEKKFPLSLSSRVPDANRTKIRLFSRLARRLQLEGSEGRGGGGGKFRGGGVSARREMKRRERSERREKKKRGGRW